MEMTHHRIIVEDFELMIKFYRDLTGIEPQFVDETNEYSQFELGNVLLAFYSKSNFEKETGILFQSPINNSWKQMLIFNVEEVDKTIQKLEKIGVTILSKPKNHNGWGRRTAYIEDPEGNIIELGEYIDSSPTK